MAEVNIDNVVAGNAELEQVDEEYREIFNEIFLDDDSDEEMLGFNADDLEGDEENDIEFEPDEWVQGNLDFRNFGFYGEKKINIELDEQASFIDFVKLFLDDHIFDLMVEETNKYAADFFATRRGQNLKPQSRFRNLSDVSRDDVKRFIALIIGMGLVQHQDLHEYWTKDELLEMPGFRKVMAKNKFLLILSMLYVCNNDNNIPRGQEGHDPIFKIRKVNDHLRQKFADVYSPGENIAIDEGMVAWRGNLSFRVYMPDKPDKFGVKFFMLCDSSNGYCSQIEIYSGMSEEASPKGKIYDIVMRLVKPYLNKGHKLYVDNYYTSPILFNDLWHNLTGACGTMRSNRRGVPNEIKQVKLKKGESVAMTNGTLQVLKWKDKREVLMCTAVHNAEFVNVPGRTDRATGAPIRKPQCVLDYNKHMGAVDRCDQMITYPAFKRRTLKWWKKVFFHLLMMAVLNAYILYKEHCKKYGRKSVLHRIFRREVVKQMIAETNPQPVLVRGAVNPRDMERLAGRHFLTKILPKEGQKK